VGGCLGGTGHGHVDGRPIARCRATPLRERVRGGWTRHDHHSGPGRNVERAGRTASHGPGDASVGVRDGTAGARGDRETRIQDRDLGHRPADENRRTRLGPGVRAGSGPHPDAHGPAGGRGDDRREGATDIEPAGSRRNRRLGGTLEAERQEGLMTVCDLDDPRPDDRPVRIQRVRQPTLARVRADERWRERVGARLHPPKPSDSRGPIERVRIARS